MWAPCSKLKLLFALFTKNLFIYLASTWASWLLFLSVAQVTKNIEKPCLGGQKKMKYVKLTKIIL